MIKKLLSINNIWFYLLSGISILLLLLSFLCPPRGIIDNSVLAATGEIFAYAALGTFIKALDMGVDAKFKHGATEVEINNDENKK